MKFKHKNVLVYGLSVSGEWASKLLLKEKANVFLFDDNEETLNNKRIKGCFVLKQLNENYISQLDCIIVSPSITKDNKNIEIANRLNIKIFSELEFASLFCKNLIAVTGTNGKTTTVQLIEAMLKEKKKTIACGNIGYPVSRAVLEKKKHLKVVEVSTYMLENAECFSPKIATILNIEADHLSRHKTMDEYTKLKLGIFKNLTYKDYAIVNLDSKIEPKRSCRVFTYSQKRQADVYAKDGYIYLKEQKICAISELKLKGKHNIQNILTAIACASIHNVKPKLIRKVLLNFRAENYRLQQVATINDVTFVNDSKSTNIASTLAGVEAVKGSITLLLGGSKKGLNYSLLFSKLSKRVKQIFAFGEIAQDLELANNCKFNLQVCKNLNEAFKLATESAKRFDTILLSPASASYDQYSNYIERGNHFNNLVKNYEAENQN